MKDLGIVVFAHTREKLLDYLLLSLEKQDALRYVDLWVDGYQGVVDVKHKVEKVIQVGNQYDVPIRRYHKGGLGFRKLILLAMQSAVHNYKNIIFLEDDCFPTRNAMEMFQRGLEEIENDENVFSVYGHPFMMGEESGFCSRFQGWGWATTSKKLAPYVDELIKFYSMTEQDYLEEVDQILTKSIIEKLDITPPRQPTYTLKSFFAWDETLAMLTARDGKRHMLTKERSIYNCGLGEGSSRFHNKSMFMNPPFNLVSPDDVWNHF